MKVMAVGGIFELLEALRGSGNIELSVLDHPSLLTRIKKEGVADQTFPFSTGAKIDLRAILAIRHAIRRVRPDIVHAFSSRSLANAVLATAGMAEPPKLISFRGAASVASRHDWGFRLAYLNPRVAGHACASDAVRQAMIQSGIPPEKCVTVYDCVRARNLERPGRSALAEWGVPPDAFVIGTVATIRPVKGIDLLLKASILCADLRDIYWVLIGPLHDREVERLAQDARIRDRIRLLGLRTDAKALISGADLFVLPSRAEGLSLALLEAMSQRVCPVVSDAGGMKEVVRHGRDGLVVPKEDAGALAEAVCTLHADRKRVAAFAESSSRRIAETFTAEKMAERTRELYHRVITQSP